MTTSGTVGQTSIEVADILDHVMRRCGSTPAALTPELVQALKNNLFYLLTTLSNRGVNLWRVSRTLTGLYVNQTDYTLAAGTLDVQKALWRNPTQLTGTVTSSAGGTIANLTDQNTATTFVQASTNGNVQWDFGSGSTGTVFMVGLLPFNSPTLNLVFETSTDAVSWTTVLALGSAAYTDSTWVWNDINTANATRYFRVRETGGGTISMREIFLSQNFYEVEMYRMNRDDYASLPQKKSGLGGGNTVPQWWLDRQSTPKMVLWPNPQNTFQCVSLFSHMQIQDVGALNNTIDIPQRWYDALVSNLAYNSILEIPGADLNRAPLLEKQAMQSMVPAEAEERDASPINIMANIGPYTA